MATVHLKGYLSENGELKLEQPIDLPPGEVDVIVASKAKDAVTELEEDNSSKKILTLGDLLDSGLAGLWKDYGITDSAAWVEELRRNEEDERNPWTR